MGSKPYRSRGVTWGLNLSGVLPASHIIKASVDEALTVTFLLFLFLPSWFQSHTAWTKRKQTNEQTKNKTKQNYKNKIRKKELAGLRNLLLLLGGCLMSKSQLTLSRLTVALILRLLLLSGVNNCSGRSAPSSPSTTVNSATTPKRLVLDQQHHRDYCWTSNATEATAGPATPQRLLLDQQHHRDYCWTSDTTEDTAGPATPQRILLDQRHHRGYCLTRNTTETSAGPEALQRPQLDQRRHREQRQHKKTLAGLMTPLQIFNRPDGLMSSADAPVAGIGLRATFRPPKALLDWGSGREWGFDPCCPGPNCPGRDWSGGERGQGSCISMSPAPLALCSVLPVPVAGWNGEKADASGLDDGGVGRVADPSIHHGDRMEEGGGSWRESKRQTDRHWHWHWQLERKWETDRPTLTLTLTVGEKMRDRQTGTDTDSWRESERQTDRPWHWQLEKKWETDRPTLTLTVGEKMRDRLTLILTVGEKVRDRQTDRQTLTLTLTVGEKVKERQTDTDIDSWRESERLTDRQRHWYWQLEKKWETDRPTLTYLIEQANSPFHWGNKRLTEPRIYIQWHLQPNLSERDRQTDRERAKGETISGKESHVSRWTWWRCMEQNGNWLLISS